MSDRWESGRKLWLANDRWGLGLPVLGAGALFAVGTASDPLLAVTAVLLLGPYLAGYVVAMIVRGVTKTVVLWAAAATFMVVGTAAYLLGRDATILVYVMAPGCGLLVATGAASFGRGTH